MKNTSRLLFYLGTTLFLSLAVLADPQKVTSPDPAAKIGSTASAEHDPPPVPEAPLPAGAVEAFEDAEAHHADLLDALYAAMRQNNAGADGITYWLSGDNALEPGWIQQTPSVWGRTAAQVPELAGRPVSEKVTELIASAQRFIDITTLSPFSTGQFHFAVVAGLTRLAHSGRPVTVRILAGWYPDPRPGRLDQVAWLREVIKGLKGIPGSRLKIYVAAQRNPILQWNHSKMVAIDGQRVLVGGQNLWDGDYLRIAPVHDLNVVLRGPFVFGMDSFADRLWQNVCSYPEVAWKPAYWESGWADVGSRCLATSGLSRPAPAGSLRVLGAGRLASLMSNGDASSIGFALALRSSKSSIRLAQQDIGYTAPVIGTRHWWDEGMKSLAKALVARQHVYIVLTNDHATGGPERTPYWNGIPIRDTADKIKEYVQKQPGAPTGPALRDLLCTNLHLAPLRFGPSDKWGNNATFANHTKFFMIDDRLFYVGSENFYPVSLQEYGVFLNDATAASQIKTDYWDQLWKYSSRAAISGSETTNCHFK